MQCVILIYYNSTAEHRSSRQWRIMDNPSTHNWKFSNRAEDMYVPPRGIDTSFDIVRDCIGTLHAALANPTAFWPRS